MDGVQEITLRRERAWSEAALADLAPVMPDADIHGAEGLALDVAAGDAALFAIYDGDRRAGTITCRFDNCAIGSDFVIIACRASVPGVDLTETLLAYFEPLARQAKATRMRIHTARAGLVRKLERRGYQVAHSVLTKDLRPGMAEGRGAA